MRTQFYVVRRKRGWLSITICGRKRSHLNPDGFPVPVSPFIAACAIEKARIVILAVYHSAQRAPF
jgi:hypothetical protein